MIIENEHDLTGKETLVFLRKLRDKHSESLSSWLDTERQTLWLDQMVEWREWGSSAFYSLRDALVDSDREWMIEELRLFRAICSRIHEKERETVAAGLCIADA